MKRLIKLIAAVALVALLKGTATAEDASIERVARIYNNLDHLAQVEIQNGFAYVAAEVSGLQIFNVSNPAELTPVGYWNENVQPVSRFTLNDIYAYVVSGNVITVLDVSDPTAPQMIGELNSDQIGIVVALLYADNYLYVVDQGFGIRVINVSDPTNPAEVGQCERGGLIEGIAMSGNLLIVSEGEGNISLFDITQPTSPRLANTVDVRSNGLDLAVVGNYLYSVCGGDGLNVFEIGNDASLEQCAHVTLDNSANSIAIKGDLIFIASSRHAGEASTDSKLEILDISDPIQPRITAQLMLAEDVWMNSVAVENNRAVVAGNYSLLFQVDISDPESPETTAQYQDWGWAYDIAVSGNLAAVAEWRDGFRAVDITDPSRPVEVARSSAEMANAIAISDGYAYMLNGDMGLFIYDLAPDAGRLQVGFYETGYTNWDLAIQDRTAYIVNQARQLVVIDCNDPANLHQVGFLQMEEIPRVIIVKDGIAYLASTKLSVVDVSDLANIQIIEEMDTPCIVDMVIEGDYLYAAQNSEVPEECGLTILDVSNGGGVQEVGSLNTGNQNSGIAVKDGYAFIADGSNGIRMVDARNPSDPVELEVFDTPGSATKIQEQNGYLYVADNTNIGIYRFIAPNSIDKEAGVENQVKTRSLLSAYPNPFNSVAKLSWSAPAASPVRLSVYNIAGAKIVDLINGVALGGRSETLFNAGALPTGVYIIRLEAAEKATSQTVRLVR